MGTTVDSDMIAERFFAGTNRSRNSVFHADLAKKGVILKVARYITTGYIRSALNVMLSTVDFLKVLLGYWSARGITTKKSKSRGIFFAANSACVFDPQTRGTLGALGDLYMAPASSLAPGSWIQIVAA
jgi:hypothetical protein